MTGIEIVAKLAEQQKQYDYAHRPTRSPAHYHRERDYDGEWHISQYRARS